MAQGIIALTPVELLALGTPSDDSWYTVDLASYVGGSTTGGVVLVVGTNGNAGTDAICDVAEDGSTNPYGTGTPPADAEPCEGGHSTRFCKINDAGGGVYSIDIWSDNFAVLDVWLVGEIPSEACHFFSDPNANTVAPSSAGAWDRDVDVSAVEQGADEAGCLLLHIRSSAAGARLWGAQHPDVTTDMLEDSDGTSRTGAVGFCKDISGTPSLDLYSENLSQLLFEVVGYIKAAWCSPLTTYQDINPTGDGLTNTRTLTPTTNATTDGVVTTAQITANVDHAYAWNPDEEGSPGIDDIYDSNANGDGGSYSKDLANIQYLWVSISAASTIKTVSEDFSDTVMYNIGHFIDGAPAGGNAMPMAFHHHKMRRACF